MTMDIGHRKTELKSEVIKNEERTEVAPTKTVKRPFDVAFLMQPDEKLAQKQTKFGKHVGYNFEIETKETVSYNNNDKTDSEEEIEVGNNNDIQKPRTSPKLPTNGKLYQNLSHRQQVFDDPRTKLTLLSHPDQKSAFTKVSLQKEPRASPNLSASPDLTYQNSLSPSPPIANRNYSNFQTNILTQNHLLKSQNITYQNNFVQENFCPNTIESPFLVKTNPPELLQPNFSKMRPVLAHYRPEIPYNYQHFQTQDILKMSQPEMRNPAAAILTSLLPPSLAALSLPAQNVCAKCNVSFRMTSDLVYHMRSHHKNDSVDFTKKRREDKLKCPVCAESFRERHHLTRHMTAHQDKEDDADEPELKKKTF